MIEKSIESPTRLRSGLLQTERQRDGRRELPVRESGDVRILLEQEGFELDTGFPLLSRVHCRRSCPRGAGRRARGLVEGSQYPGR